MLTGSSSNERMARFEDVDDWVYRFPMEEMAIECSMGSRQDDKDSVIHSAEKTRVLAFQGDSMYLQTKYTPSLQWYFLLLVTSLAR